MSRKAVVAELGMGEGFVFQAWLFVVRFVAPIGVVVIFLHAVGLI
jgi:NSS family neurotransmitter:Na+ symporter